MRRTAQIKETVMHTAAATNQHIAGYARIETAGNQRQHIFLRTDREAANAFITAFDQQQTVLFDFQMNRYLRRGEVNARTFDVLIKPTADVTFNIL